MGIRIAIDGPASSGKSTIAKLLAKKMGYIYLDTGAMYRCMTLALLNEQFDLNDELSVTAFVKKQRIDFVQLNDEQRVLLNDVDVTQQIRENHVTENVSLVSSYKGVREELVAQQRTYIKQGGIIMDGRDIGTVVMPDAELKIFMLASAAERARRRYQENIEKGITISLEDLTKQIEARDLLDSTRIESPLKKADDAVEIDTTELTISQVVDKIYALVPSV